MDDELLRQVFISAATRQGVPLDPVEAQTLLETLRNDGIRLKFEADWSIKYRWGNEEEYSPVDLRELVEIAADELDELIAEKSGDYSFDDDLMQKLYRDSYIVNVVKERTANVIPAKLQKYIVGIVAHYKMFDTIEASCWSEAEAIAKNRWSEGRYQIKPGDFRGIMITHG